MTQEQKYLVLKDLCARLPYGVAVKFKVNEVAAIEEKFTYVVNGEYSYITNGKSYLTLDIIKALFNNHLDEIKPYLFPMSSMTVEQRKEYESLCIKETSECGDLTGFFYTEDYYYDTAESIDYLNKNNFDYRGLIEKGLAIDATGLNIY